MQLSLKRGVNFHGPTELGRRLRVDEANAQSYEITVDEWLVHTIYIPVTSNLFTCFALVQKEDVSSWLHGRLFNYPGCERGTRILPSLSTI